MAHVRPYDASRDFAACLTIFRTTADASVQAEPVLTIGSYLWCRAYLHLDPEKTTTTSCFVLDDGVTGRAVGYCIGTPDSAAFCRRWRESFLPSLSRADDAVVFADSAAADEPPRAAELRRSLWTDVEGGCDGAIPGLWDRFPGHLHINILPSHQGRGFGPALIHAQVEALKAAGCPGLHMGVVASNAGALRFYERNGFERFEGISEGGELGRQGGVVIMAKRLA